MRLTWQHSYSIKVVWTATLDTSILLEAVSCHHSYHIAKPIVKQRDLVVESWIFQHKKLFSDRVSASRRAKFAYSKSFQFAFCSWRTQALLAYSPLYWLIGLSHYFLHLVLSGKNKCNRENPFFLYKQFFLNLTSMFPALMFGWSIWTEEETFPSDWSQRTSDRGSEIIFQQICSQIPDFSQKGSL